MTEGLPTEVAERIGPFYVYMLRDPRNGYPFYVGKGTQTRLIQHGADAAELSDADSVTTPKRQRIREIRKAGYEPIVDVVRHGITDEKLAYWIEAALIDTLPGLLNSILGRTEDKGRSSLAELSVRYGAQPLSHSVSAPALLIRLGAWVPETDVLIPEKRGHGYFGGMPIQDLYNSTRAWWKVSSTSLKARGVSHVVAVHQGVTRAIFTIDSEEAAGERWGFKGTSLAAGQLFDEYVGPLGKRVNFNRGAANPVTFWPR